MQSIEQVPVGCVIFDETSRPDCGWYALDEEEARRFFSLQELPKSGFWLTNVGYELGRQVFQGLSESFGTSEYLREDLLAWAVRHRISDHRVLAETGARLLSRVLALCRSFFGLQQFLPVYTLRHGLKEQLGSKDMLLAPDLAQILEEATVINTMCRGSSAKACSKVIFCLEPRGHCLRLLDQVFPSGRFSQLSAKEMPGELAGREDMQAFVQKMQERPGFFLCLLPVFG